MSKLKRSSRESKDPLPPSFVLFGPSKDGLSHTHPGDGNLLYSIYRLNAQPIQKKTLTDTPRTRFNQNPKHPVTQLHIH